MMRQRHENRNEKKRQNQRGFRVFLTVICVLLVVLSLTVLALGIGVRAAFARELPENFLGLTAKGISPKFYGYRFEDRQNRIGDETELGDAFFSQQKSVYTPIQTLQDHVKDAFIAIEDKRFYEHRGVDWYRTVAAGANYLLGFSDSFGASTVTQQLIKNLTGNAEVTLRRKMQEIFYALDLERTLDKSEILELYLNVIHFGEQCDGIGEAAAYYFSKSPQELTVAEGATLAAIINNPSYYNPIRHPQNNLQRRNLILSQMYEQGKIDSDTYEAAKASPLGLHVAEKRKTEQISSWYADMVIEDVIEDLCKQYQMSRGAASGLVYSGGLKIYTAIDETVQTLVEDYYRRSAKVPVNANGVSAQSALIVIDPHTGDVLGVAGAIGKKTGNRLQNFATQTLRPPGSALKPITVYAPALERRIIRWSSVFDDVPVDFGSNGGKMWPRNANYGYRGLTDVAYAMAESTNTVAVKILEKVGLRESFLMAKSKFHLGNLHESAEKTDCDRAALALGQLHYGVTLRELATAYTAFADAGVYHPYRSYYRVLDAEGHILLSNADAGEVVLSAGNAAVMTKLMQGVVEEGTASTITLDARIECAGKTGTTGQDQDRWFVGYTPDWICGVWCGFEYPEPMGGKNVCLKIWDDVMTRITSQKSGKRTFDVPSSLIRVSYCKDSGKLPCEACGFDPRGDRTAVGWFVRGTEPREMCDCHVICEYDAVCGGLSHGNCPAEHCEKVALLRIDRQFPREVTVADAQYVLHGDPLQSEANPHDEESYFLRSEAGFFGKSNVKKPFNRSCVVHLTPQSDEDEIWWKRYWDTLPSRERKIE